MGTKARVKAQQVGDSTVLKALARMGLIGYGVVYLLIGWLALQLAWGGHSKSPDPSGAFRTLAEQPLGRGLLTVIAIALVALGVWKAAEALVGHRNVDGLRRVHERVRSGFWAGVYAGLGVRAAWVSLGPAEKSADTPQSATVGVLAWPGGRAVVVVSGLIVISVGLGVAARGVRQSFSQEMDTSRLGPAARTWVLRLGQVGYITKGVALGLVGGLLTYAAWTFDWRKASGLDAALQTILEQPFGTWLLSVMAFGFVAFGLFAVLQFRYRRM